jgi:hypothetical protein
MGTMPGADEALAEAISDVEVIIRRLRASQ